MHRCQKTAPALSSHLLPEQRRLDEACEVAPHFFNALVAAPVLGVGDPFHRRVAALGVVHYVTEVAAKQGSCWRTTRTTAISSLVTRVPEIPLRNQKKGGDPTSQAIQYNKKKYKMPACTSIIAHLTIIAVVSFPRRQKEFSSLNFGCRLGTVACFYPNLSAFVELNNLCVGVCVVRTRRNKV